MDENERIEFVLPDGSSWFIYPDGLGGVPASSVRLLAKKLTKRRDNRCGRCGGTVFALIDVGGPEWHHRWPKLHKPVLSAPIRRNE